MKLSRTFLFSILIVFAGAAGAQKAAKVPVYATRVDESCRLDLQDPFDLGWRITEKSVNTANHCVNTKAVRSVTVLQDDSDEIVFANFYHDGKFWKARWKKKDLPRVSLLTIRFNAGVPFITPAHSQLRFQFTHGLELTSHKSEEEKTIVKDVVFSWETAFAGKSALNFVLTVRKNFPIAGRALSLAASRQENTLADKSFREFEEYPLDLEDLSAGRLWEENLKVGSQFGLSVFFRLIGENCTTRLFETLDTVLRITEPRRMDKVPRFKTSRSTDPIMGPVKDALNARGLTPLGKHPLQF